MTFFNKKEEVLDIQLTQYGKCLLSKGEFTPTFYAFFDDGIVYDSKYIGFGEEQNAAEGRIQNQTPSLKTQHVFSGAEERIAKEEIFQTKEDKLHPASNQLGNTSINTDKMPAWDIKFYQGSLFAADEGVLTGSNIPTQNIPQLEIKATYKTRVIDINEIDPNDNYIDIPEVLAGYNPRFSSVFDDGTFIDFIPENLLIEVLENNTDFEKANFDIEVFIVEEVEHPVHGATERLKQLMFQKQQNNVINDILYSDADLPLPAPETNRSYVDYYFDIYVDEKIDEAEICKSVGNLKSRGYRVEAPFECPDDLDKVAHSIYRSNVTEEDLEECQD